MNENREYINTLKDLESLSFIKFNKNELKEFTEDLKMIDQFALQLKIVTIENNTDLEDLSDEINTAERIDYSRNLIQKNSKLMDNNFYKIPLVIKKN